MASTWQPAAAMSGKEGAAVVDPNPLATLLRQHTVADAMTARPASAPESVVVAQHDEPIGLLIDRLARAHILGVPVLKDGRVIGNVEMRDIALFLLASSPDPEKLAAEDLKTMTLSGRSLAQTQVAELIGMSGAKASMALPITEALIEAARIFESGVHRVTVFDPATHEVKGVVSQSDLTRFIVAKLSTEPSLKAMANRALRDYGYTGKGFPLHTVKTNEPVIRAVQKLAVAGVTAVAVVDPSTGALRGNFSATDLRGLQREQLPHLTQTVLDFLEMHSPESLKPIAEPPETRSLLDTCKSMVTDHIHRVWVIDEDRRPAAVITMTDVAHIALTATA